MQSAKVTSIHANNPIPVYGVEATSVEAAVEKSTVTKTKSAKTKSKKVEVEESLDCKIALCAYFKAQERGFAPGFEMEDWLAAEQEVK
ncbi:MAG: DUF2934 domain-containing protein [Methylophilaceae bacterium]